MKQNYLKRLSQEREGYILLNKTTGVEVKSTEKFLDYWLKRGFSIIDTGIISLISLNGKEQEL